MADPLTVPFDPDHAQPEVWQRLRRFHSGGRVGSAYLFCGPAGSGKEATALAFARLLNCERPETAPCGECPSCTRIAALQDENLTLLFPLPKEGIGSDDDPLRGLSEKTMASINEALRAKAQDSFYKLRLPRANTIPISAVRELRKTAYYKTALRGRRMIIIFDADLLATGEAAAANALLKILEEPPPDTTFVLVTDTPGALPPTIRSRCQQVDFPPLAEEYITVRLEIEQVPPDTARLAAGLSLGNLHLARRLSRMDSTALVRRIADLARQVTAGNGADWREFVNQHTRLATSDPDEYRFDFYLLRLWFRAAYRLRRELPDVLHRDGLQAELTGLNRDYPACDYLGISAAIDAAVTALARNYHPPLILTNFLTAVRQRMQGD